MEKMILKVLLMVAVTSSLSACNSSGGGDDAPDASPAPKTVDSNGACTTQFISGYNSIVFELKSPKLTSRFSSDAEKRKQMQVIDNACKKFYSTHQEGVSCKAEVNYVEKQVNSSDHKVVCNKVDAFLNPKPETAEQPVQNETPAPVTETEVVEKSYDSEYVYKFKAEEFQFEILDLAKLKEQYEDDDLFMINGKIASMESNAQQVLDGAAICFMGQEIWSDELENGDLLEGLSKEINSRRADRKQLSIILQTSEGFLDKVGFGCVRYGSNPLKLHEIREAVQGILEISIVEQ